MTKEAGGMHGDDDHIAVIGMACRFPGAKNVAEFWSNLVSGLESLTTLPAGELLEWGEDQARIADPRYQPPVGFLDEAWSFDAPLFGYAPREAALIDPQQRVFLECAWAAIEDAGHDPRREPGPIGVYAGCGLTGYAHMVWSQSELSSSLDDSQFSIAIAPENLATRVSYKLGLTGPSVTVMTACSSSLVAIHQAGQALLAGECDMALAGGVSVRTPPRGYIYREGGIQSRGGHVRAFDADADGTVTSDGVGVVVLRRLADAVRDRDHIHAVVRGSAVNNDGANRVGYTAPSVTGQAQAVKAAHAVAQVAPDTIGYVEAHGTGTPVGDPIEVAALTKAFGAGAGGAGYCALGSVKTNIGHAGPAAGAAGFIKAALAVEHGLIPPSLHFSRPNPEIGFAGSPFYVNATLRQWQTAAAPRRAGVSSFGVGGTNAHVVLEQPPRPAPPDPPPPCHLLVLSANTRAALDALSAGVADHLAARPDVAVADVAFTLQLGRPQLPYRRFAVCADHHAAQQTLAGLRGTTATRAATASDHHVVFMFPGQGAQHAGMAAELCATIPCFGKQVEACCALLARHRGLDLSGLLRSPARAGRATRLDQTMLSQPALFITEYALALTWLGVGVTPAAMIGHSLGELVAACLAGVFSVEDALLLAADRGRMMQELPAGTMLAVPLAERDLRPLLGADLSIAAVNGPDRCVASGPARAAERLRQTLTARGIRSTQLRTSHAFHSAMIDPILPALAERVAAISLRPPAIPFASGPSGTWITPSQATDPAYWARQGRDPVRFGDALAAVLGEPGTVALEVGPGQDTTTLARRHPASGRAAVVPSQPRSWNTGSSLAALLTAAGRLWQLGVPVRLASLQEHPGRRVSLPAYPFERQRHVLPGPAQGTRPPATADHLADGQDQMPVPGREPGDGPPGVAPARSDPGQGIAALFEELFGTRRADAGSDFFDLGGDSLSAAQLAGRIAETFQVTVPIDAIFDNSTLGELTDLVRRLLSQDGATGAPAASTAPGVLPGAR